MGEEYSNQTLHEILVRMEKNVDEIKIDVSGIKVWRGYITGAVGLLGVIGGFTVPIILQNLFK